jgi:hypothetical protein
VKSPDVLSRPLKNVSIACAVSFKVNQSQNRLLRDVKLCSSHFPPIENKSQYQSCGKMLAAELVHEDAHQNGLQSRTFEKVHGLTWFNSVILEWSTKRAQFNTENWLFWE